MQFLSVAKDMTMGALRKIVGAQNIDNVLSLNQMPTVHNIGEVLQSAYQDVINTPAPNISSDRKISILNSVSSDADVFEAVALQDENSWKYMSAFNSLPMMLRIPDTLHLPESQKILSSYKRAISKAVYNKAINYLLQGLPIDPIIFDTYSTIQRAQTAGAATSFSGGMPWFNLPWGEITLHSSITDSSLDFPVYPEEYEDGVHATYDTMPDMIYQYEPWYTYKSSGPRSPSLTFKMHRDMWTGDHRDGKCNELIRFCQAQCYPEFKGAAVNTAISTLYIAGKPYIRGIITEEKHTYSGPLGLDKFPLYVEMTLTFTEIASTPLNFDIVRKKGLIN